MIDYSTFISVLKDIVYLILFAASVIGWWKNSIKNSAKQAADQTKVNLKLDTICQSQTDIKDDIRELKRTSNDTDKRLSVLEEMIKVANHRIDDLEKRGE